MSRDFYKEVIAHPIPIDLRAIHALKRSAMALDVYTWLTYRMSYLRQSSEIPWAALRHQFGSEYADTKQGRYGFRRTFSDALRKVLVVYPDAKISLTKDRVMLSPSKPHVRKKLMLFSS